MLVNSSTPGAEAGGWRIPGLPGYSRETLSQLRMLDGNFKVTRIFIMNRCISIHLKTEEKKKYQAWFNRSVRSIAKEVEARRFQVQGPPGLLRKFKAGLNNLAKLNNENYRGLGEQISGLALTRPYVQFRHQYYK